MIVISDTSPINYLILIDHIALLPALYGTVIVPAAVLSEMKQSGAPRAVSHWAASPPRWAEVREPSAERSFPGLDAGESQAIALALELRADFVLMDERKGRRIAAEMGLAVSGTLAILEQAAQADLIVLADSLELLKQTSFHISEQVLQSALRRDRERRQI